MFGRIRPSHFISTLIERHALKRCHPIEVLRCRAAESSADLIERSAPGAVLFRKRRQIHRFAVRRALANPGLFLEFGVFKGKSINAIAADVARSGDPRTVHGFDAFQGLAEAWPGSRHPRGAFDRGGRPPRVRDNVELHVGWIHETLPRFLEAFEGPIAFMNIDTDTYEAAACIFDHCRNRFVSGSIVVMDEFFNYPNWKNGEYRAWQERFVDDDFAYLAFARRQACVVMA
ncbi:MAG: class I SAM-dependent methyltransferase [Longimicrobiales bacterium]|nr:class I SAM-dependent methyltransferase [Longimicrobiales bacterium]